MIITLIAANYKKMLKYKLSFALNLFSAFLQLLLFYFFWKNVFYYGTEGINSILLSRIVYITIGGNLVWELSAKITTGNVVNEISKPYGFFMFNLMNHLSENIVNIVTCGLILFVGVIWLQQIKLSFVNYSLFILSLILGVIVCFCLDYLVSFLSLFTNSTWGISAFREGLIQIFSGALFPIALMPSVSKILYFFPFRYIVDIPVKILLSDTVELLPLLFQLVYTSLLVAFSFILEKKLTKFIQVQGG